jgi:hypothetical protein
MVYRDSPNWLDRKKWDEVRAIGLRAMEAAAPLKDGTPDEWAQNFIYNMLMRPKVPDTPWPFSEAMKSCILQMAARFVESEMQRLKRRRKKTTTFWELEREADDAPAFTPVDTRLLPEDTAILVDIVYLALLEIDAEKPVARYVYWNHVIDEKLFTEIAKETGEPADNLRHLCARVIKRLRAHVNGKDLTEAEIRDFLNMIDRHRHGLV